MIADEQLREALEYTLAVLQQIDRRQMDVAIPKQLQPLLKFKKLSKVGLSSVRRVLEDNDDLRAAIGTALSVDQQHGGDAPEDPITTLWLDRPDGWEELVETHQAQQAEARRIERLAIEERSTQKRLAAAERHLERVRADLTRVEEELVVERKKRHDAERRAKQAEAVRSALERQVDEARNETRRAKQIADTARSESSDLRLTLVADASRLAEAEKAQHRLIDQLDEALRSRVEAENQASSPAQLVSRDDSDLIGATQALRDAARALSLAADAVSGAMGSGDNAPSAARSGGPVAPRPRPAAAGAGSRARPGRSPLAIPGGRYGDDVEVARHLVAVAGTLVLVDGYNVAKTGWPDLDLDVQRDRLVDALENLVRRVGTRVRVVFDGAEVVGWSTARRLVHVQFSNAGVIADDTIREIVMGLADEQSVIVVSSDKALVSSVRAMGANTLTSRQLVDLIR